MPVAGWKEFKSYLDTFGGAGTRIRMLLDEAVPALDLRISGGGQLPLIYTNTGSRPFEVKLVESEEGGLALKVYAEQTRVIRAPTD